MKAVDSFAIECYIFHFIAFIFIRKKDCVFRAEARDPGTKRSFVQIQLYILSWNIVYCLQGDSGELGETGDKGPEGEKVLLYN